MPDIPGGERVALWPRAMPESQAIGATHVKRESASTHPEREGSCRHPAMSPQYHPQSHPGKVEGSAPVARYPHRQVLPGPQGSADGLDVAVAELPERVQGRVTCLWKSALAAVAAFLRGGWYYGTPKRILEALCVRTQNKKWVYPNREAGTAEAGTPRKKVPGTLGSVTVTRNRENRTSSVILCHPGKGHYRH